MAGEILEQLKGRSEAGAITIGGGLALKHYLDLRPTVDLDAWWATEADPAARRVIRGAVSAVSARHGWLVRTRSWGETESHEIIDGTRKIFAFQIARRDVEIDPPVASAWPPVLLETLRDNLGAKMNALVQRGAPRDFVDVFHVCTHDLATPADCWELWTRKNPGGSSLEARAQVLARLSVIESRRPLQGIAGETERRAAARLRLWVKQSLCEEVSHDSGNRPDSLP